MALLPFYLPKRIQGLFFRSEGIFFEKLGFEDDENKKNFYYRELLPVELNEKIGYSKFLNFIFTNEKLDIDEKSNIYKVDGKNIYYF